MRVFKTRLFAKWSRKEKLSDTLLCKAVKEMEEGLVDADLGGNVYKKRIALPGQGKRSSIRSILAYRAKDKAFFIFGYAKNENMTDEEKKAVKILAKEMLAYTSAQLGVLVKSGKLIEVKYDG